MSLFSLNRIYKPNRHTPTPLTQTHILSIFPLERNPLFLSRLANTDKRSRDRLCEDFVSSLKKKSEGNCLRWWEVLSAGGSGGRMDGWIEGTFCSSCAGSDSHIVPGEAGCHLWFKGPQPLDGWEQDMAIVMSPALVPQRTSNQTCMRRWQGGPATSLLTLPSLHSVSLSCLGKALRRLHLPW